MPRFKRSLTSILIAQVIAGYAVAADYVASIHGPLETQTIFEENDRFEADIEDALRSPVNMVDNSQLNAGGCRG